MARGVGLLMPHYLIIGKAREIVIGLVVLADVIEAEAMVLALASAALGRGIESRFVAARVLASRTGIAQQAILVGLDAQAVEEFRVELHGSVIMRSTLLHNKHGPRRTKRVG
jgi:hypothetical protein